MAETNSKDKNSQLVQSHLQMLQAIIQRMASNSASCKTWCITLVSAIIVVLVDKEKIRFLPITFIPILLFLFLDTYYLWLESRFRKSYNDFVTAFHNNEIKGNSFFVVDPVNDGVIHFLRKILSLSIWPFYLTLIGIIVIVCLVYT